jgi:hypothetical protein
MSSHSVEPYRTPSGRIAYERMSRDLATKLVLRERELSAIPKPVRVVCRIVCRLLRGRA